MFELFSFIILILSVIIHEVSHGYAALYLGDSTAKYSGRLTLNPLKHLDLYGSVIVPIVTSMLGMGFGWAKPVPFNPENLANGRAGKRWGEALVAIAGPASNILIALVFSFIIRILPTVFSVSPLLQSISELSVYIILVNITLAVFNLVPVPPLDGSKILFSLIPRRYYEIRNFIEQYQIIFILIFIFFIWQWFQPLVFGLFRFFIGI